MFSRPLRRQRKANPLSRCRQDADGRRYRRGIALEISVFPGLLIHLFRHFRAQTIAFPSVMLLKETQTTAWRRTRLQEWLLLALRTLIILLLVAAIGRPAVRARLPGWLGGSTATVAVEV